VGAAVSNGILIGGRMLAPGAAQSWDKFAGDHVVAPVGKFVGKLFGVDERAIDAARSHESWGKRLESEPAETASTTTR
jgi:hypothetical protein